MRTLPDKIATLRIGAHSVDVDEQGFLSDPESWDAAVAEEFARRQGLTLTEAHWAVIGFMRDFLAQNGVAPDARFTFRFLEQWSAPSTRSGRDLFFELFPYGYVSQACKIAGLRQPRAWSTG